MGDNPIPWDIDTEFPTPDTETWRKISATVVRRDDSVVEMEFLRPAIWLEKHELTIGVTVDIQLAELGIDGSATINHIDPCPLIEAGAGRVVTGRFVTRNVTNMVRVKLTNGEFIDATDVHPFWSVNRQDWINAGDLKPLEQLDGLGGAVFVAEVIKTGAHPAVYNLEVHAHHVFRVANSKVLVHNGCWDDLASKSAVTFGENLTKKVRKHIDQVRKRGGVVDDIPSPGKGGVERVQQIIQERVAQGGGRATTYAGEAATAFEDGGVTYILRANGEFWTILKN